jgi:hypothetical protein
LIQYFGQIVTDVQVTKSITVSGNTEYTVEGWSGDPNPIVGDIITVSNDAPFDVNTLISNDAPEEITVDYFGELILTQKNVVFDEEPWTIPEGAETVNVRYTLVGDEFRADVADEDVKEGYVLIYYKDNSDRFNSPAKAIKLNEISGNLPYEDDANADEYDYCATGEYETCHGAKIWYVPENAISEDGSLDWSRATEFYYETALIQYNADGVITIYPTSEISFRSLFTIGHFAETAIITTGISPAQ